jgi:DNA polymerase-3 subunit delta
MMYLYYGSDDFRVSQAVRSVRSQLPSHAEYTEFDFAQRQWSIAELAQSLGMQGLFGSERCVHVKQMISATTAAGQKEYQKFWKDVLPSVKDDTTLLLIFSESGAVRTNSAVLKFLRAHATEEAHYAPLSPHQRTIWIRNHLREISQRVSIDSSAAHLLSELCGENLYRVHTELQKLVAYIQEGSISVKDVEALTGAALHAQIFETIEAATGGNKSHALVLYRNQLQAGDDPFYLFSMYVRHMRILVQLADLQNHGVRDQKTLASRLKLHPFVVQKSCVHLARYPLSRLKSIYSLFVRADESIKTGAVTIDVALERLLLAL